MRVYFGGPLFTPYAQRFVTEHAEILREHGIEPLIPTHFDPPSATPEHIFDVDYGGIADANAMVVLLDGTQVDDGTACEIGIFYGLLREDPAKKGIVGWITDVRGTRKVTHGYGLNLFVLGVIEECGSIFTDFDDVLRQLEAWQAELG